MLKRCVCQKRFPVSIPPHLQIRMWQLQQLQARHMVLEQQAKSAATATSKTQREVYVGGLTPGVVSCVLCVRVREVLVAWCVARGGRVEW